MTTENKIVFFGINKRNPRFDFLCYCYFRLWLRLFLRQNTIYRFKTKDLEIITAMQSGPPRYPNQGPSMRPSYPQAGFGSVSESC